MVGIALFGAIGYKVMPVSDLPTVDYPTISVSCEACRARIRIPYPGFGRLGVGASNLPVSRGLIP